MDLMKSITQEYERNDIPAFGIGDTVRVHIKIKEGNRERIQVFEGFVLKKQNGGISETFTVRKISNGIGVEKTFPLHSPKIEFKKHTGYCPANGQTGSCLPQEVLHYALSIARRNHITCFCNICKTQHQRYKRSIEIIVRIWLSFSCIFPCSWQYISWQRDSIVLKQPDSLKLSAVSCFYLSFLVSATSLF